MTEVAIAAAVVILVSAVCSLFEAVLYSVPASHVETVDESIAGGRRKSKPSDTAPPDLPKTRP